MLKTETRVIGDIEITVTQFPPRRAFRLMSRLAHVIAPALSKAKDVDLTSDVSALGPAIGAFFGQLSESEADKFLVDVLASSTAIVDGKQMPLDRGEMIDTVFSGDLMTMLRACVFALEVNFGNFLAQLRDGNLTGAQAKESVSTLTPISRKRGRSGASG